MPQKPRPSKRPDGTLNALSKALQLGKRRVSVLLSEGMPDTPAEALQWREKRENNSSVEELRRQRILLIQEQRKRAVIENDEKSGILISVGKVQASFTRVFGIARSQLLKLLSDVPPRLAGLNESEMSEILRAEIIEILTSLSDPKSYDLPLESIDE